MTPEGPVFHKPKSYIAAKNLLYASVFLSVINFIIHYIRLGAPSNPFVAWSSAVIGFAVTITLIKQMGFCKKWARTVLAVWLLLSFMTVAVSFFTPRLNMSILEIAIWALKTLLQVIAFIFLYNQECNTWFNSEKYEMFEK
jgi:hypothetical protein